MVSGVRVVGGSGAAPGPGSECPAATDEKTGAAGPGAAGTETADAAGTDAAAGTRGRSRMRGRREPAPGQHRRAGVASLAVLAVLGLAGTVGFGLAWEGLHSTQSGEAQARSAARSFLVDLTNFNAKTVDADFSAVTSMATGAFATQAQKFFNSAIRQDLQKALASSRGQIRALYVQGYGGGQATVYAVVDQLYVNAKLTSPQTDVLRMVVNLSQVAGSWKVSDVSVLQGPSSLGAGTSAGGGSTTSTTAPPSSTAPSSSAGG